MFDEVCIPTESFDKMVELIAGKVAQPTAELLTELCPDCGHALGVHEFDYEGEPKVRCRFIGSTCKCLTRLGKMGQDACDRCGANDWKEDRSVSFTTWLTCQSCGQTKTLQHETGRF